MIKNAFKARVDMKFRWVLKEPPAGSSGGICEQLEDLSVDCLMRISGGLRDSRLWEVGRRRLVQSEQQVTSSYQRLLRGLSHWARLLRFECDYPLSPRSTGLVSHSLHSIKPWSYVITKVHGWYMIENRMLVNILCFILIWCYYAQQSE